MNICFFLGGFHQNGGIGRVTAMLANALSARDGYSIITLCYCDPKLPNFYSLSQKVNQQYFLQTYSSMSKQLIYGGIKKLRSFLRINEINVLIACGALYYPLSVLACKGTRTKVVCWEHSDPEGNKDHRGQYYARRFGIKRSDLNVVLTQKAFEVFQKKYGIRNTIQIYNPIDDSVISASGNYNPCTKRIISVGRLSYQKNFELAIEIAGNILPKHPEWHWDVYGKGEDRNKLQKLIMNKGIDRQFHLCGQVEDLYERYKYYSIMVMTSRYEGFPMSLLEGLGNGLPLISFDIPTGPSEIIKDGYNGYLIRAFDEKDIEEKLVNLMNNDTLKVSMSKASKQTAIRFSQKEIVDQWSVVLRQLIVE